MDSAPSAEGALPETFHPLVAAWFAERYGSPTPVQAEAWPRIADGSHVLASAPTGSGKTLTAFLDALSRFALGALPPTGLSVLYVSPLKALNEDVRLNLLTPLRELSTYFKARGEAFPALRVATRSGDTPPSERRSLSSRPPSILCTTPESLAILLASQGGLRTLSTVRLVVLDEIHAVLGQKRGTMLASSIERLALIAGDFQRVALSATVRPFEEAARFAGGYRLLRVPGAEAVLEPRRVEVVSPAASKRYAFRVEWPEPPALGAVSGVSSKGPGRPDGAGGRTDGDLLRGRYGAIVEDLHSRLRDAATAIVFADSRRRAERLAALINDRSGEGTAWAHHGSLSKDVRKAVETRLKEGRLRCVVATGTLELGIDVGSVELVAMAGSPARADQALQRAGRAGHGVGLTSRAVVYPFHGLDLLAAQAAVGAALDGDVDPIRVPEAPLDVLAQVILSKVLFEERSLSDLYDEVRAAAPYASLSRADFDAVAGLLAGRYAGTRVKELGARAWLDAERGTLRAREGAARLLYASGGAIPDRGYYAMRNAADGSKIGELDEEFVFERRVGNSFVFGAQAWRITAIGDEAVTVTPLDREADFMPFWKAEKASRGPSVARRMLEACAAYERDPEAFESGLRDERGFSPAAARALRDVLAAQARAQKGVGLPAERSIAVELYRDPSAKGGSSTVVIHTLRGAAVNEPLGLALAAALGEALGLRVERLSDDDSVLLVLPLADTDQAESAVRTAFEEIANPERALALVERELPSCAAFGSAFRENAGRALLLPRGGFGRRTPLWITRLKAKRLYEKTAGIDDFPVIKETWKSALAYRFDLDGLFVLCRGLSDDSVALGFFRPAAPSPFARQSGWAETNRFLYEGDGMAGARGRRGSAADDAIEAALDDASARPRVPESVLSSFLTRLRREEPGWAPETPEALLDWVDERVLVPADEWEVLAAACPEGLAEGVEARLHRFRLPGASMDALATMGCVAELIGDDGERLAASLPGRLSAWLETEGPASFHRIEAVFGLSEVRTRETLESRRIVYLEDLGQVGGPSGRPGACDRGVLEALFRGARKAARPTLSPRPIAALPGFLAAFQCVRDRLAEASAAPDGVEATRRALLRLAGYPAPAGLWETEILPARVRDYRPEYLDTLLASGEYLWYGAGKETVAFAPAQEYAALAPQGTTGRAIARRLLRPGERPMDIWALKDRYGLSLAELEQALWEEIWDGTASSDSFEAVRKAAASGFARVALPAGSESLGDERGAGPRETRGGSSRRIPAALRGRWKVGAPLAGLWFSLALEDTPPADLGDADLGDADLGDADLGDADLGDADLGDDGNSDEADRLEQMTMAARAVTRRAGVLCRATVQLLAPLSSWQELMPALRRMELAGELVAGRFFDGLAGLQFMGREAFELWKAGWDEGAIHAMNAGDPASAAGLEAEGLEPLGLPQRSATARLVMRGSLVACVARRSYRELELRLGPREPELGAALSFLVEARRRIVAPERRIAVAVVNGEPAATSPYAHAMASLGFDADRGVMTLW